MTSAMRLSIHIPVVHRHFALRWWGGEVGIDDRNGWPLAFVSWGGRPRSGVPMFSLHWRWRGRYVGIDLGGA